MNNLDLFRQTNVYDSSIVDIFFRSDQIGSIKTSSNSFTAKRGNNSESFATIDSALEWIRQRYILTNKKHAETLKKRASTMLRNANYILDLIEAIEYSECIVDEY
ncbi:MAG: hypothetical protein HQ565_05090 [Bacteroidetes bacterium]|nr:hypothetical protein [Bacteroidota bacterium]